MKVNQKKIFIILVSALTTAGCVPVGKKFAVEFKDPSAFTNLKLDVSSVQVQNNQLIVHGSGLKDIKTIKLVNNGVTETLVVESATSGQLVANGLSAVAIGVGKIFDMVLADAYGSATVPVTFTLEHGSITAAHLSNMGAVSGQVLKYNGTAWEPSTLSSSQVYQGVWNANTNTPNLNLTSPVSGEYYIVSVAGTYNSIAFDVGDWIIHNGTSWDKVVSSAANKLSLSGGTLTGNLQLDTLLKFKGAANYVSLKASSTLAADIILTLPKTVGTSGQFLTTDGTGVMSWTTPVDPVIANLDAAQIADGSVSSTAFQYLAGATSNIQAQLNAKQATGNFVTALTGDVTASGAGSVTATVATVGGATAANIAAGITLANAATDANTASAIIKRDSSGNFSAGTITGTFSGNATNVSGVVAVANGGTGNTTLGVNQLLFGNGTSAVSGLAITGIPSVLLSTVASGAPAWTTSTTGNVLKGSVSGVGFGALDLSDLPAGTLSGSGTANYIPYYNTTSTLANSPMAISGSNVGIGTTAPTADLHVVGKTTTDNFLGLFAESGITPQSSSAAPNAGHMVSVQGNSGAYFMGRDVTNNIEFIMGTSSSGAAFAGSITAHDFQLRTNNVTRVTVQQGTGNVGIGTTAPGELLHVHANTGVGRASIRTSWTDTTSYGEWNAYEGATFMGGAGLFGSTYPTVNWRNAFVMTAAKNDLGSLIFRTKTSSAYVERMVVTNAGNVGIGTTSPLFSLDVSGNTRSGAGPTTLTTLSTAALSTDTTLTVGSTTNYPSSGVLYIYTLITPYTAEAMSYTGKTATTFTGITRGLYGTTATALSVGYTIDQCLTCTNINSTTAPKFFLTQGVGLGMGTVPPAYMTGSGIYMTGVVYGVNGYLIGTGHNVAWGDSTTYIRATAVGGAGYLAVTTASTERLRVDTSGNVGIGTTAPSSPLHVVATGSSEGIRVQRSGVTGQYISLNEYDGSAHVIDAFGDKPLRFKNESTNYGMEFYVNAGATNAMTILPSGNVGIGTTTPANSLVVSNNQDGNTAVQISNTNNTANASAQFRVDAASGIGITFSAVPTGHSGTLAGYAGYATVEGNSATTGLSLTAASGSGVIDFRTGGRALTNRRMFIDSVGNVGIGVTTPSTLLHVKTVTAGATVATFQSGTGSCTVTPNAGMSCSSDIRLKENVEEIINGLDKVLNLRGVTFQWKERSATDDSRHMGFIAQEVEKVAPELVSNDARGYKQVNYANFVAVLTEAVKDLFHKWFNDSQTIHREIASVKAESAQLKKDNELLKEENKAIKSYLCSRDPKARICQ